MIALALACAPEPASTPDPPASPGCRTDGLPAGSQRFDLGDRSAWLHVPVGYVPDEPVALILNVHGYPSTGEQQEWLSGMSDAADREGYVVAYPEGVAYGWNAGGDCCGEPLYDDLDDVGFARDLVAALEDRLCVDPDRVYATGMSAGAYLAHRLGCDAADVFAAIAPVSGVLTEDPCDPVRPVPILELHGTADEIVPWDGIPPEPSVPDTVAGWVARDGCVGDPVVTFQNGDSTCATYLDCNQGAEVGLCTVDGGGHAWPGGQPIPFVGFTTTDLSATDAMWEFFLGHARRSW